MAIGDLQVSGYATKILKHLDGIILNKNKSFVTYVWYDIWGYSTSVHQRLSLSTVISISIIAIIIESMRISTMESIYVKKSSLKLVWVALFTGDKSKTYSLMFVWLQFSRSNMKASKTEKIKIFTGENQNRIPDNRVFDNNF